MFSESHSHNAISARAVGRPWTLAWTVGNSQGRAHSQVMPPAGGAGPRFKSCRAFKLHRQAVTVQVQTRMLRRADNLYFHTVIMLSVPSRSARAGPGLWPGLWENSQALRRTAGGALRAPSCAGPTRK